MRSRLEDANRLAGCEPEKVGAPSCSECKSAEATLCCFDENCPGSEGFCEECAPYNTIDGPVCLHCGRELGDV